MTSRHNLAEVDFPCNFSHDEDEMLREVFYTQILEEENARLKRRLFDIECDINKLKEKLGE